jgi:REP element-mobilizing transposase RayT
MSQPLVIAYHLIWTSYGHWLPNDPRGSGSKTVASDLLAELGQPAGREIQAFYDQAHKVLKYPVLTFGPVEIAIIAKAFGEEIAKQTYTCYGCAVMPDHAHLLIRKHKHLAEDMIENLQNASRAVLGAIEFGGYCHPIWTLGGWKVFLDHPAEVRRTIRYIRSNPGKEGLEEQTWDFVKDYDDWPLHPGHNPNSPWARRLRERGDIE